jgi:hypothetical protein
VFRNAGGTKFEALTFDPAKRHRGAAFGDLNGDGRIDAVVTALNAPAELLLNESPGVNHWLMVDVPAIGARVKIVTARGAQYNHVTTSTGYASSSAGPVHFGLGDATTVDSIEVRWPNGAVQKFGPAKVDQVIKVPAPSTPARP